MLMYYLETKYLCRGLILLIRPYVSPNKFRKTIKKTIIIALDINNEIFVIYMAI